MVRVLATSVGAKGHFHPLAPLCKAAMDRGHEVRVCTNPSFSDWVKACGFEVVATEVDREESRRRLDAIPVDSETPWIFHAFSTVAVPPMIDAVSQLAERWMPEIVIHEEGDYSAPLLAAMFGIPCITQSWSAPARPEAERAIYRRLLQPIWSENGVSAPARTSGDMYLDACPPAYQTEAIQSIPDVLAVRPTMFDGPPSNDVNWLAELPRPAAYISFGTVDRFSTPEILTLTVDAVSPLVASTVVTTGPNPVEVVRSHSADVHVHEYLPQTAVLPYMDLVISHGGAGTTLGSVIFGLPHLVIPCDAESQIRNAERTAEIGAGSWIARDDLLVNDIRRECRRLLSDDRFRSAALETRRGLDDLPSVETVVELLEATAVRRSPAP